MMASKAICGRLQKLEAEISQLVAQHLLNFQKERDARAKKCQECCHKVERKRSSSEPRREKENQLTICVADNPSSSQPSSRRGSPNRNNTLKIREFSPKRTSIIKSPNDNEYTKQNKCTCNIKAKQLCKCCMKKSVQFSNGPVCTPRKTYTVEELFKIKGRLSSTSQRNPCICEYPPKENIEDEILGDTLNIQTTLFQMPSMKETFKNFDSRALLAEKLQALENENKRLNASLKDETRLREAFMEEAKREIQRTEKLMDEKIVNMNKQAMESMQQVAAMNNNLVAKLEDKEETLQKMSNVAAKLKIEQERERCKCKLASNLCKKLKDRNNELQSEREAIADEIEKVRGSNKVLKGELIDCKNKINSLSNEINTLRKQKEQLQDTYQRTARRAESQMIDLRRKKEIETELDKLTNVLKRTEEERSKLDNLVRELRETILSQKKRLEELIRLNEEHEVLLRSQKAALDSKDEQIRLSVAEATIIKRNSFALEQRLTSAEESLRTAQDYSQELEKARQAIDELKDTILLKENIINDQTETLITLKKENDRNTCHIDRLRKEIEIKTMEIERHKCDYDMKAQALQKAQQEAALIAEEFRKATMKTSESITRVKKMSVEIATQNATNQNLSHEVVSLKEENQKLHNKVDNLQKQLENVCHYTSAGDMERQQLLITYLEQQVALQQREWEIQKRVINKEKSKALQTAKFATKKLLETVHDFQKQTEMQKRVHVMLTNMLQDKENKLHRITSRMGTNLKPTLAKIEEVHEVCTKEYRVPVVRRSIYSPPPELADGASSNNESSIHEDDEESLDVPATSRLLPRQDDTIYGPRARRNQEEHSPSFLNEDNLPEDSDMSLSKKHKRRY